jgi:hypothetical protein
MNEFVSFSNSIISSYDIDPDYIFLINYKNKFGALKTFDLLKKKLLIYNLSSELLYTEKLINYTEIKFGAERQKSKRFFPEWEEGLRAVDFNKLNKFHNVNYLIFRENFKKIKGMGDWACWKTADILDKVFGIKIRIKEEYFLSAYEYPLRGLLMLNGEKEDVRLYKNKSLFKKHLAKATSLSLQIEKNEVFDPSNILELETLLCKFHSFKKNKYNIGEDLSKIRKIKQDERLSMYHDMLP